MKKNLIFPILLILIILIFVGLFIIGSLLQGSFSPVWEKENEFSLGTEEQIELTKEACFDLGCEYGNLYIGSIESDKFYKCTCHWANQILPENRVCFEDREEAIIEGRTESEC